jgi:hypothetical protein
VQLVHLRFWLAFLKDPVHVGARQEDGFTLFHIATHRHTIYVLSSVSFWAGVHR